MTRHDTASGRLCGCSTSTRHATDPVDNRATVTVRTQEVTRGGHRDRQLRRFGWCKGYEQCMVVQSLGDLVGVVLFVLCNRKNLRGPGLPRDRVVGVGTNTTRRAAFSMYDLNHRLHDFVPMLGMTCVKLGIDHCL